MDPMMQQGQMMQAPPSPSPGGELQVLLDQLGISPEDLQSMFEAGVFDERKGLLNDQAGMAAQQARTPMPGMRQVGNVAVAANPLEMLAAGVGQAKGRGDLNRLMDERSTLIDLLRKGNQAGGLVGMQDMYGE